MSFIAHFKIFNLPNHVLNQSISPSIADFAS